MHICAKGDVEWVWYELPYLVMEEYLVHITAEWPPAWLESRTTGGASSSVLKTPTNPCAKKYTQKKWKDIEIEPEPTTTRETIDLEKEEEDKYGEGTEALVMQIAKGTKRGS